MPVVINGSNGISGEDGSASTPAIQGSDNNTGVFFPAADTAAIATNGTERMRIDSSGNVGIGVTPITGTTTGLLQISSNGGYQINGVNSGLFGNLYYTSGWKYAANGNAGYIKFGSNSGLAIEFGVATTNSSGAGATAVPTITGGFDSSGNLGIGTNSPGTYSKFVVSGGNGNFISYLGSSTQTILGDNGGTVGQTGTVSNHPFIFITNATERARIDSSGNLLVGTTSITVNPGFAVEPSGRIYIGRSNNDSVAEFYRSGTRVGLITVTTTNTAYNTSSDYRLKENIAPMTGALAKVAALKPVTYTWKSDGIAGQGFIAHELAEVVPQCVTGEKDAVDAEGNPQYQGIDTSFLVATLTAAIQEQQAIIEQLKADVAELKGKQS